MSVSLESALRTCKVNTGYADRIQSDRFQNPEDMVCPLWDNLDSAGRPACPDSFYTKRAGCNSADDRVVVENALRPQYMEYINLNSNGIGGHIYGHNKRENFQQDKGCTVSGPYGATSQQNNAHLNTETIAKAHDYAGQFGNQFESSRQVSCGINAYKRGMCQEAVAKKNKWH